MSILLYLIASIIATTGMTIFMNTVSVISGKKMFVIRILSYMLATITNRKAISKQSIQSYPAAISLHYGVGILFAIVYWWLRNSQGYIGHHNSIEPILLGFILGFVGVTGWVIFLRLHPQPPSWVPWVYYLLFIFLAHIVFSFLLTSCVYFFDHFK